jgi:hypothetical protein
MPWITWLVAALLPQSPWFSPRPIHVGFEEEKVALEYVFSEYFCFLSVSFHVFSTITIHSPTNWTYAIVTADSFFK